ncbi:MAG: metal-dependent transcriptional regulator [Candidatus Eisenbacteria bacterium]
MMKIVSGPIGSRSIDDYLKVIYKIEADEEVPTTGRIAALLELSPASVTGMLRRLSTHDPPLVDYEKHRGATLTGAGRLRALETLRHHRLIELFLHKVLGFGWDEVHEEAENLEHVISETLEDRIAERLGHPTVDPHGDPIPAKDGSLPELGDVALISVYPGAAGVVSRVKDGEREVFRYLGGIGLVPGAEVTVVGRGPFDGPVTVRTANGEEHALGRNLASKVYLYPGKAQDDDPDAP